MWETIRMHPIFRNQINLYAYFQSTSPIQLLSSNFSLFFHPFNRTLLERCWHNGPQNTSLHSPWLTSGKIVLPCYFHNPAKNQLIPILLSSFVALNTVAPLVPPLLTCSTWQSLFGCSGAWYPSEISPGHLQKSRPCRPSQANEHSTFNIRLFKQPFWGNWKYSKH